MSRIVAALLSEISRKIPIKMASRETAKVRRSIFSFKIIQVTNQAVWKNTPHQLPMKEAIRPVKVSKGALGVDEVLFFVLSIGSE